MNDPIAAYFNDYVRFFGDLAEGREPRITISKMGEHYKALAGRYGKDGLGRIAKRALALSEEIFGAAAAPALATTRVDPLYVVEADIIAERIANERRKAGLKPYSDGEWRTRIAKGFAALHERHQRSTGAGLVTLGEVAPLAEDGLIIEGIATTKDWNGVEVPLAAGLRRLDGSTTRRRGGLDPKKFFGRLPLPALWRHDWDKRVGELFALSATDIAVHFKACIVPPGTANYDSGLLEQVWDDVRSGKAAGVSFQTNIPEDDGSWSGVELSVCPTGGNPFAVITRATFPNKQIVQRAAPTFTLADAQRAWLSFDEQTKPRVTPTTKTIVLQHDKHGVPVGATVTEPTATVRQSRVERDSRGRITEVVSVEVDPRVFAQREAEKQQQRSVEPPRDGDDSVPLRAYKFVWRPDGQYDRGDVVTSGGAGWICLKPSPDRPGTSKAWRLMEKSDLSNRPARAAK